MGLLFLLLAEWPSTIVLTKWAIIDYRDSLLYISCEIKICIIVCEDIKGSK